ncbi:hypothetical protein K1719_008916 [Acacia pycnantha]|nr:hypothetical protein K1719_008916 [Acacia pycnantha]
MDCVYKNLNKPIEARVKDLLSRMTLKEKIYQLTTSFPTIIIFTLHNTLFLLCSLLFIRLENMDCVYKNPNKPIQTRVKDL